MTTTLLLIDIQNDYFPGGAMELVGSPQAGARAGKLLHAFQCLLAHDACATKALSFGGSTVSAENVQTAFLAALNGLFARVLSVEEICAEL